MPSHVKMDTPEVISHQHQSPQVVLVKLVLHSVNLVKIPDLEIVMIMAAKKVVSKS